MKDWTLEIPINVTKVVIRYYLNYRNPNGRPYRVAFDTFDEAREEADTQGKAGRQARLSRQVTVTHIEAN